MRSGARAAAALFTPTRLTLARQLKAITRTELARRAGVSPAAVSQYESGATRPRAATLAQLALVLQVPVEFFSEPASREVRPTVDSSFFRSLRRTTQRNRERAVAHADLLAQLVEQIERAIVLPPFVSIPDLALDPDGPAHAADEAATELRRRWQVPDGPIQDVVRLIEQHGVVVARMPMLTHDVDAFSWSDGPRPLVILGADKGVYERSRLDAAHELAHIICHAADPEPASRPMENQANRFAAAFLLPAKDFELEWPAGRVDWRAVQRIRQRWGLSMGAVIYRAKQLGLLDALSYESAMRYMSKAGWRTQEPPPHRPPETPSLLREASRLLQSTGTTLEVIAARANLPADIADRLGLEVSDSRLHLAL